MRSDLVDLTLHKHYQTDRAIFVSEVGDERDAVWIPLAHIEVNPRKGNIVEVTMPEWLAKEKGLV